MKDETKHSIYERDIRQLSKECQYLILSSVRGTAKSYACKMFVLKNAMNDEEFCYLRRTRDEIKDVDVIDYFNDMNIYKITEGKYDCVDVFRKRIYFCNIENNKIVRRKKIGYTFDLMHYDDKKSLSYPSVSAIIFEEYCTERYYLDNEPAKLQHFVSTIFRERKGFCILIGNKINKFNPYFSDWDLKGAPAQACGTIDTYYMKSEDSTDVTIIKVYDIKKIEKTSVMFFGNAKKNIDGNDYETREYAKLGFKLCNYECIYDLIVECQQIKFYCQLLLNNENSCLVWYVQPKTTEIFSDSDRVISDRYSENVLSTRGFVPLTQTEQYIFTLFKRREIAYSTNRCGTDFNNALNILERI